MATTMEELIDDLNTDLAAELPVRITHDNRGMLEIALQAETDTIERYERRVAQADELGLTALKVRLEDLIVDETRHKEEIEMRLLNWKG